MNRIIRRKTNWAKGDKPRTKIKAVVSDNIKKRLG